jgi:hypothetical protein
MPGEIYFKAEKIDERASEKISDSVAYLRFKLSSK